MLLATQGAVVGAVEHGVVVQAVGHAVAVQVAVAGIALAVWVQVGLGYEALTRPQDPGWLPKESTLREPPEELFPGDLDDAGLSVEVDGGDEEPGEP